MARSAPVKKTPSKEYLDSVLIYFRNTGTLIWKYRPRMHFATDRWWTTWNERFEGNAAFCQPYGGYLGGNLDNQTYSAHRIIWKMETGDEPPDVIDHIDRDKTNNRFDNLRASNKQQNGVNTKIYSRNTSGVRGVSLERRTGKWAACINHKGKRIHLGTFASKDAAGVAYRLAAKEYHGVDL